MATWFDDEDASGRRLKMWRRRQRRKKKKERDSAFTMDAKVVDRKVILSKAAIIVLVIVLAGLTLGLLGFCGKMLGRSLFSNNDRFLITNLEIESGPEIPKELVKQYCQVDDGTNLFAVAADEIRANFMDAPNVKGITIERRLPGTLRIIVHERRPLARLESRNDRRLVVDDEGVIFGVKSAPRSLPVITGYHGKAERGIQVEGMGFAALQALAACRDHRFGMQVESVDVRRGDYVLLRLPTKSVKLAWEEMGDLSDRSNQALATQLRHVAQVLKTPNADKHDVFDATYPEKVFGQ